MRVLYFTQYFPPEIGATQDRAFEMARRLARSGHRVTVVCEAPNHPSGVMRPEYRGRLWTREEMEGFEVIRVWVKTSPRKDFRNRLKLYTSYACLAGAAGLCLARGRYDVAFATSPPLFVGAAALAAATLRRLPFVFEVRDLWPESATQLGFLQNPLVLRAATWLEETCYARARRIVTVTEGIRRRLVERGQPEDKLVLIRNGASPRLLRAPARPRDAAKAELGLEGKFVALYAGVHGIAQGLEDVLRAADRLRDDPRVHFVFVGDGPRKRSLENLARRLRLPNVTMLPERPREQMRALYDAADAVLAPLKDLPLFRGAAPTKMFDAWACERPVVLGVKGEAKKILKRVKGGVAVRPEDPKALAKALRKLMNDPAEAAAMGRRGYAAVLREFDREQLAAELERTLLEVVEEAKR